MSAEYPDGTALESLLTKALADDLPPDVAAGMRAGIERFRVRAGRNERRPRAAAFLFRRTAWAALSILMLMSGGLLQGLGSRTPLADRLSALGILRAVSIRLAAAESMSCSARVRQPDGGYRLYEVEWRRDRGTLVVVKGPDGARLEEFAVTEPGRTPPPPLRAVSPLLDPAGTGELLSGGWRLLRYTREGGRDIGVFAGLSPDGRSALELAVDTRACLPVRLDAREGSPLGAATAGPVLWQARFDFQP